MLFVVLYHVYTYSTVCGAFTQNFVTLAHSAIQTIQILSFKVQSSLQGGNTVYYLHNYFLGKVDSSGLRLSLTQTARELNSGLSGIGSVVHSNMIVPPNANHFSVFGYCPSECTSHVSRH